MTLLPKQLSYKSVYDANYFSGKKSFFYWLTGGYRDLARVFDGYAVDVRRHCTGGRLLDVGCAYGFLLRRFEGDFETFGVDVSEHAIEEARKTAPGSQLQVHNVLEPLPFADRSFDVVTITDLLEHVPGTPGILAEVARVLRPGGILYITTPNRTPWRRVIFGVADLMEHHTNLLSYRQLGRYLDGAGFEVVERFTSLSAAIQGWRFSWCLGLEQTYIARRRAEA